MKECEIRDESCCWLILKKFYFKEIVNFCKNNKTFEIFISILCITWNLNWKFESCIVWDEVWDFNACIISVERKDFKITSLIISFIVCIRSFLKSTLIAMISSTRFLSELLFLLLLFMLWSEKFWRRRLLMNLSISASFNN